MCPSKALAVATGLSKPAIRKGDMLLVIMLFLTRLGISSETGSLAAASVTGDFGNESEHLIDVLPENGSRVF